MFRSYQIRSTCLTHDTGPFISNLTAVNQHGEGRDAHVITVLSVSETCSVPRDRSILRLMTVAGVARVAGVAGVAGVHGLQGFTRPLRVVGERLRGVESSTIMM